MSDPNDAAALTAVVLDEEEARRRAQAEAEAGEILPDDLLPGVGGEPMRLRAGLRVGRVRDDLRPAARRHDRDPRPGRAPGARARHPTHPRRRQDHCSTDSSRSAAWSSCVATLPFAWLADRYVRTPGPRRARPFAVVGVHGAHRLRHHRFQMGIARAGAGFGALGTHPDRAVADRRSVPHRRCARGCSRSENLGRPAGLRWSDRSSPARSSRSGRWARPTAGAGRCSWWPIPGGARRDRLALHARARAGVAKSRRRCSAPSSTSTPRRSRRCGSSSAAQRLRRCKLLPLPRPRDRRARLRARRACRCASTSCSTSPTATSRVHPRLGLLAHLGCPRCSRSRSRAGTATGCSAATRATRCGCSACWSWATASSSPLGSQFSRRSSPSSCSWHRQRVPGRRVHAGRARRSPRWCRTACGRRRSR